jgi:hypothetical protein
MLAVEKDEIGEDPGRIDGTRSGQGKRTDDPYLIDLRG